MPARKNLEYLVRKQYVFGYMVFLQTVRARDQVAVETDTQRLEGRSAQLRRLRGW
jgi:hypothetical protein